jgi:DNA-binding transcriptional regulator YhcF (GntR family)
MKLILSGNHQRHNRHRMAARRHQGDQKLFRTRLGNPARRRLFRPSAATAQLDVRRSVPGPICEDRYVSRSEALREESPASHAASSRPRFARLEQPRAQEYVAEQLRREITLGLIQAGEKLPSERDLLQLLGVSRFTVQQALNLLETEGLVAARRDRGGGTFVIGLPRNAGGKRRLIARIRRDRDVIAEAVACRVEVESAAAAQAADLRIEEDLTALRDLLSHE